MENRRRLFAASFTTLIVAGVGFAIRGAILADWGTQFGFTKTELGTITGGGLVGFGIVILAVLAFMTDAVLIRWAPASTRLIQERNSSRRSW